MHCNTSQYAGQRRVLGYKRQLFTSGGSVLRLEENRAKEKEEEEQEEEDPAGEKRKRESPYSFCHITQCKSRIVSPPLKDLCFHY